MYMGSQNGKQNIIPRPVTRSHVEYTTLFRDLSYDPM